MSLFRKLGQSISSGGRNLFKKQVTGVNKLFSKVADALGSDQLNKVLNSPVTQAIADKMGVGNSLAFAKKTLPQAQKFARVGAEVPNVINDISQKGVNKNTIERVSKLASQVS